MTHMTCIWVEYDLPGITEMVLSALSTLKVLNAETFPRSTNSVTYLKIKQTKVHS